MKTRGDHDARQHVNIKIDGSDQQDQNRQDKVNHAACLALGRVCVLHCGALRFDRAGLWVELSGLLRLLLVSSDRAKERVTPAMTKSRISKQNMG